MKAWSIGVVLLSVGGCRSPAPAEAPVNHEARGEKGVEASEAGPRPELGNFGIDLTHQDGAIKAGDDFYRHVNGQWLKTYQLKPDEMRYGSFIKLVYRSEEQVKAILDDLAKSRPEQGSTEQKVGDYYRSFLDEHALEEKGIAALKDELAAIEAIKNQADLVRAFGQSGLTHTNCPLQIEISVDRKDPSRYQLEIAHSGLGLPERSYYLEENFAQILGLYQEHVAKMLRHTGTSEADAKAQAKAVLDLEKLIAQAHWPRAELRDAEKTSNPMTYEKLVEEYPGYPWKTHLEGFGTTPENVPDVNVTTPSAIVPLAKLVKSTPLSTWRAYLKFHLVTGHASLLGPTIDDHHFAFYGKVLGGQQQQRDRWKRAIQFIGPRDGLGDAIGKLYVQRHYPPEAEAQMTALVRNLRAAFKKRLLESPWMGESTRKKALEKLAAFNPKIGHPKEWRDFSEVEITASDLMANVRAVRAYWHADMLSRLGKKTDRDEWFMTPQTINAYYNPLFNEIVFPAAILQPPFFDPHADPAVNYGAIGAVIGHEMSHGFDDQGSRFNAQGVQADWWTDEDRKKFEERTARLVEQYGEYEPLPGQKLNGQLTLGENIGDLGGLNIAYEAYLMSLDGKPAPQIDGLSGAARFFLSWGQLWASVTREQTAQQLLKVDPHSPGKFRVNGVVRNVDAWYQAFSVSEGDALYLAPNERVSIW